MRAVGEPVHAERRGRWLVVMVVGLAMLAWTAAPAGAATGFIDGTPLNIYADDTGRLQVAFDGSATGEFFSPGLAPANAGLNVAVARVNAPADPFTVYGFLGTPFTATSAPVLGGDGSPGNPWTLDAGYQGTGSGLDIFVGQHISYVNGTTDVNVSYSVVNPISNDVNVQARLYEAADLYVAGSDAGAGILDPGPPRQVGGVNQAAGSSGRLVEQTPWSHYQEGPYGDVFSVAGNSDRTATGFNDTTDPALVDNGAGVQWDFPSIAVTPSAPPQTVSVTWRFKHFTPLQLTLSAATRATGQTATVTVAARNGEGNPDPGRSVRYTIAGANPGAGVVTTGADGTAAITWTGATVGTDTLTAFTDLNGNGIQDGDEPQQTAIVTWTPPPPPVPGKSVVVRVVSGTVLVKYPPGYMARATAPAKGFVPFKGAANIPVGSQVDTQKGRVALTSAQDTGGVKTQESQFYDGIFQVKQAVPKKKPKKAKALITDLVMKGQIARSQCAPLKGARAAGASAKKKKKGPKSVLGKLWGSGKGKFRTSGKYSSATVRGTIWLVEDRCDGTLTKVSRGTVSVRDIKRKKTVTVKAGHSYLARAQRAASKSKRR
jgi:hypothetical protein